MKYDIMKLLRNTVGNRHDTFFNTSAEIGGNFIAYILNYT